jgi:pantoate--beta-alanine ligase
MPRARSSQTFNPRPPIVLEKIETIGRLRAWRFGEPGGSVALVPTMGALHAGHAALIETARRECGVVVVSIFVNPTQFNNQDDLARYPRTLDADLAVCRELGVDVVFAPSAGEVYPAPLECSVDVGRLADHLCGRFRPGHFRGVATVVLKLFQMVQPHRAYFGEKDAQQLAIIRRLAADFNVPIEIVEVPTVREADGLAMSSRNRHLSADERAVAPILFQSLQAARQRIAAGERDVRAICEDVVSGLRRAITTNVCLEYVEIVDPLTMQPVDRIEGRVRVAGAMWIGSTRLIDNILV